MTTALSTAQVLLLLSLFLALWALLIVILSWITTKLILFLDNGDVQR